MKSERVKIQDLQAETQDALSETDLDRIQGGRTTWGAYILPYIEQDNLHRSAPKLTADGEFAWHTTSSL